MYFHQQESEKENPLRENVNFPEECVCVCVCERERETERQRDRERESDEAIEKTSVKQQRYC